MAEQIKVPAVGESVTEATLAEWLKQDGDIIERDDVLLILETDKASVEIVSEFDGALKVKVEEGETVSVGTVLGEVDTSAAGKPAANSNAKTSAPTDAPATESAPTSTPAAAKNDSLSPAVRRVVSENHLDPSQIPGSGKGGRITKADALNAAQGNTAAPAAAPAEKSAPPAKNTADSPAPQVKAIAGEEVISREPMTKIRQTIAKRLVQAQQTAAILTTFNEIDMTNVMALRKKYKEPFNKKYGINLGFMGFFVKASIEALKDFPRVNGYIDGTDVVFHHYHHIGIAVGTPKGLMVPVLKHADQMSLAEIELSIKAYANKARDGKISIADLSGGTFTISNGGVYGSLMSTPILNPPQSGILGLHKIEERPMAINGEVKIRPMMYIALSYDHRIIDGAESVKFLVRIKECIEDPTRILMEI